MDGFLSQGPRLTVTLAIIPSGGVSVRDATVARQMNGRMIVCGMELISPRWLMTACHCILNGANTGYEPAGIRGMSQVRFDRPPSGIVLTGLVRLCLRQNSIVGEITTYTMDNVS